MFYVKGPPPDRETGLGGLLDRIEDEATASYVRFSNPVLERLQGIRVSSCRAGPGDQPARQQTLRATIEWSYVLLDEQEERLFRQLAVFVGGFTLEAAERVCKPAPDAGVDVLDGMQSLVDKSLIIRSEQGAEQARFSVLDTIHEYAQERLVASQEVESTQSSHAGCYVDFAETAARELVGRGSGEVDATAPEGYGSSGTPMELCPRIGSTWRGSTHAQTPKQPGAGVARQGDCRRPGVHPAVRRDDRHGRCWRAWQVC